LDPDTKRRKMAKKTRAAKAKHYGKELILDLHNCDPTKFNRSSLRLFFKELCEEIKMNRAKLVWWDDHGVPEGERQTLPHLKGTSAVQFIMTSNIVVHTLDILGAVYINIFSCKDFDTQIACNFCAKWFNGDVVSTHEIDRI
jgi:S-adenosylmethionine decarboxylase